MENPGQSGVNFLIPKIFTENREKIVKHFFGQIRCKKHPKQIATVFRDFWNVDNGKIIISCKMQCKICGKFWTEQVNLSEKLEKLKAAQKRASA